MTVDSLKKLIEQIQLAVISSPFDPKRYEDWISALQLLKEQDKQAAYESNRILRKQAQQMLPLLKSTEQINRIYEVVRKSYLFSACDNFSDYMFYIEWDRQPDKRFYQPRMKYLRPMVQGYQDVLDGKLDLLTVSQPKRTGKALTLDTKLLTPYGWICMGDVRVGQTLIGADGRKTIVTDVFPQGTVPVYDVKFSTGAVIRTCGSHLWAVKTEEDRGKRRPARVMSTEDMLNGTLHRGADQHNNYSVDYMAPAHLDYAGTLPIHPYLFGVLIGDGSFVAGVTIVNPDSEIIERCERVMDARECLVKYRNMTYGIRMREVDHSRYREIPPTLAALRKYGLDGKRSYEKFIPEEYLWSSEENRWELLRGLMDTDGFADTSSAEFSSTSKALAEQVVFLVRSLGGYASIKSRVGRYTVNGSVKETRLNYRVTVIFPKGKNPFYLSRKRDKFCPKREVLRHFIADITPAGYAEAQCICVDNPDHLFVVGEHFIPTHNSQTEINFVDMMSGRNPNRSTLIEGAGDALVNSFYKGCLEYFQDPQYRYYDVFPDAKLVATNADMKTINIDKKSRFPTIMCRSIDATQVGLSEATNAMILDDCVLGREEAMNRARLDQKWDIIRGDVLGRRIEGTPIIATGTRYSLYDPIGRLQEEAQRLGWRWRAIEIPALDPVTDESNYEHVREGKKVFTTAYFRGERELLSADQWESEFQQQPFEAKGLLFPESQLQRYFKLPPDKDPDAIVAVCDTKEKGEDYVMLPVAYIYGADVFIEDVVFDDGPPESTKPQCARVLFKHKVGRATFESNNAGEYYARDVEELLNKLGGSTSIRTKRTISNKQTRIEMASDNILKHFWFKDKSTYDPKSQYAAMIKALVTYTRTGKNLHDDCPDGLSLLENDLREVLLAKAEPCDRLF